MHANSKPDTGRSKHTALAAWGRRFGLTLPVRPQFVDVRPACRGRWEVVVDGLIVYRGTDRTLAHAIGAGGRARMRRR